MHALALSLVADCFGADVAAVCSCLCTCGPMLLAELLVRCEADHEERSAVGPPQRSQIEQPKAIRAEQVMLALSHALHMGFVLVRRDEPAVVASPTPKLKSPPRFEFVPAIALRLLCSGRIIDHAADRFGASAGDLVRLLLARGGMPADEVCAALATADGSTASSAMAVLNTMKRRRYLEERLVEPDPTAAAAPSAAPLVTVAFQRFFVDFRDAFIEKFASEKFGSSAGVIVKFLLELGTDPLKPDPSELRTPAAQIRQIVTSEAGTAAGIDVRTAHSCMKAMCHSSMPCATLDRSTAAIDELSYHFNIGSVVGMLQMHAVVAHIEKKFSPLHARIMRLLLDRVCLDEKTIGDLIMTPGPMTRTMLYQLRQEQFLRVEELAAKPDLNPQSAHYIWHADNNLAKAAVVRLVCKSLQNLRIKLAHEKRTAAGMGCFLNEAAVARLARVEAKLQCAMSQLEEQLALMLFW